MSRSTAQSKDPRREAAAYVHYHFQAKRGIPCGPFDRTSTTATTSQGRSTTPSSGNSMDSQRSASGVSLYTSSQWSSVPSLADGSSRTASGEYRLAPDTWAGMDDDTEELLSKLHSPDPDYKPSSAPTTWKISTPTFDDDYYVSPVKTQEEVNDVLFFRIAALQNQLMERSLNGDQARELLGLLQHFGRLNDVPAHRLPLLLGLARRT